MTNNDLDDNLQEKQVINIAYVQLKSTMTIKRVY